MGIDEYPAIRQALVEHTSAVELGKSGVFVYLSTLFHAYRLMDHGSFELMAVVITRHSTYNSNFSALS